MLKIFKKIIIAGILAFVTVNIMCLFYYKLPARKTNETGSTDYKWKADSFFCRATEGFGYGKINDDGFNNSFEPEDIDVLLMGSSQLEGFNVPQKNILSELLNEISDLKSYNIGVSAHTLLDCFDNLESALKTYNPKKYIVFETMSISFYKDELEAVLNGGHTKDVAYDKGIVGMAQDIPYLRLVALQLNNLNKSSSGSTDNERPLTDKEMLGEILLKVKNECTDYGLQPVIIYHPTITANKDYVSDNTNEIDKINFCNLCEEYGIVFIDMAKDFIDHFNLTNEYPHGFSNTTPGFGHLNSVGHKLMADKLNSVLSELEDKNDIE